jgi:hypothetical protein
MRVALDGAYFAGQNQVSEVSGKFVFAAITLRRREAVVGSGHVAVPDASKVQDPLADVNRGGKRHTSESQ